jgi:hypothetical protein
VGRNLGLDEVVDHFTLVGDELVLLRNTSGATRLGFAALLKFLLWRGRFPRAAHELPQDAVAHLARQVRVPAGDLGSFDFAGRSAQRYRGEIRGYTGFRECSVLDAETLAGWLSTSLWSSAATIACVRSCSRAAEQSRSSRRLLIASARSSAPRSTKPSRRCST